MRKSCLLNTPAMDAKLDSRQGQFPASFPDTFKDFFAVMSEDEDHLDLFSNLLEDKVIPHHNNASHSTAGNSNSNRFMQRRHGGSLRCPTHPQSASGEGAHHSVGRSSSFRVHRPRNPAATYGGGVGGGISSSSSIITLNSIGQSGGHSIGSGHSTGSGSSGGGSSGSGNGNGNLFCKHIKYCCLHQQHSQLPTIAGTTPPQHHHHPLQQQQQQAQPQQQQPTQPKSPHKHRLAQQSAQMQTKSAVTVPTAAAAAGHYLQQHVHQYQPTGAAYASDYSNEISGSVRMGPDGEDNSGGDGSKDRQQHLYGGQHMHQQQQHHHQQQQQRAAALQKRHSVILERAFDFDASCEESDTISTTSSTPTPAELPSLPPPPSTTTTVLKPILKKPTTAVPQYQQMHAQQQQQQQQHLQQHPSQHQQQMQLNALKSTGPATANAATAQTNVCCKDQMLPHRALPQPPKGRGFGAYHTKEAVLHRVQQQSGLLSGSRTNLNTLSGMLGSAINLAGIGGGLCANANSGIGNNAAAAGAPIEMSCGGVVGDCVGNSMGGELRYSNSNYNFDATTVKPAGPADVDAELKMALAGTPPCCVANPTAPPTTMASTNTGNTAANVTNNLLYMDLHTAHPKTSTSVNKFSDLLNATSASFVNAVAAPAISANANNSNSNHNGAIAAAVTLGNTGRNSASTKRVQKSPLLTRRRSSSIVTNLLASDVSYNRGEGTTLADITNLRNHHATTTDGSTINLAHSATRDRITLAKSPVSGKPARLPSLHSMGIDSGGSGSGSGSGSSAGVLTFQQAMSGAVSPQYSSATPLLFGGGGGVAGMGGSIATNMDLLCGSSSALASVLEDTATSAGEMVSDILRTGDSPTMNHQHNNGGNGNGNGNGNNNKNNGLNDSHYELDVIESGIGSVGAVVNVGTSGVHRAASNILHSSSATIAQLQGSRQRQRMRTSSMPAESRKPRLADTRRAAIHCADLDLEYYRLRSFSITSHGVCNLGDSLRRRSRSINSVTSTGTSNSGKEHRNNSNASHISGDNIFESTEKQDVGKVPIPAYKIAMLGASGVGKTTLTYQFTTSDYICAYDLSLDDDYGQKTVSVLVDGIETDLEIIDHPACEMSTEAFCSTYNIDLFVVVYSVVDRNSFKAAEKVLQYLKEHEMLLTRGAILVGNKTDLERHREVNRQAGRKLAKEICCKFIETSSGLDHNVNELLVGIVAQSKLNPQRIRNLNERDRQRLSLQSAIQKHRHMHIAPRRMVRQVSMYHADDDEDDDAVDNENNAGNRAGVSANTADNIDENQPVVDEGIGTGSERTVSTSLSSTGMGIKLATTKNHVQRTNKRTLNLESILKMGESELEDEDEAIQRQPTLVKQQQQTRPLSKFDLLLAGGKNSLNASPKNRRFYGSGAVSGAIGAFTGGRRCVSDGSTSDNYTESNDQLLDEGNRKTVSKLTNRTKVFLSSVLKFKKAVNMRRRNSSSCSDLFVI
nr:transcription factor mef2A [Bactrocera oleae]